MTAPKDHEWRRMSGMKEGKMELVKALLDHGADPNALLEKNPSRYGFTVASTRPKGSTPYVLAAMAGDAEMMRLLVENGADPSLAPSNGVPALLWAAGVNRHRAENIATEDESLEAVKVALEHGADVNVANKLKLTPLYIADHDGRFAGQDPKIDRLPVGDLLDELSGPDTVAKPLEE